MGRVVRERKIEMVWRCSSCQNQNLGRFKECQRCGDPKDSSERFEMPGNTAAAPSVTDPALLRQANAGPDWRCGYCGSDQKRSDDRCAQCGASIGDGRSVREGREATGGASPARARPRPRTTWLARARAHPNFGAGVAVVGALLLFGVGFLVHAWLRSLPFEATVDEGSWEHRVVVERWTVVPHEGFAESRPAAAFDVQALGQRHHHDEQVLDHYETEHYTEDVPCGEDCTTTPESCSEECTSDDNGFATCRTVCSGGGQSCTTRYCAESRTREVPVYRTEARYQEWYAWKNWEWVVARVLRRAGLGVATQWPPDEEVALDRGLGEGERERATRQAEYTVRLRDEHGDPFEMHPDALEEFQGYTPGRVVRVRRVGSGDVVEPAPEG